MAKESSVEHVDVIVIGAGLSGIGAGYHLQTHCPDRDYLILEARSAIGGTWDLFRYPGVRSDSDMHTLGYSFRPWREEKSIADGPAILSYVRQTASDYGIDRHIRFDHRVVAAEWSSPARRWHLRVAHDGGEVEYTCSFLMVCSGYYSYAGGYRPHFDGEDEFGGPIIHPQDWPDDLDYEGRRVVVIGSGATAMTLVPALAERAAHVVMLQRSPTYVVARPDRDKIANALHRWLPGGLAHRLIRAKNTWFQQVVYRRTRTDPDGVRAKLLDGVRAGLGSDYDVETHFTPTYNPWDQRLCLIPNGDLFAAIRSGRASVVTDHIARFDATGIRLHSGEHLDADIIVTATGLQLVTLGEMEVIVDGRPVDFSSTFTYKGLAYSDVPNLVSTFGYINASWTLRADLVSEFACRILNHLRDSGTTMVVPRLRPSDEAMTARPWVTDFSSGYFERMLPLLPKQGDRAPWLNSQDYAADRRMLRREPLDDGVLIFSSAPVAALSDQGVGS